MDRLNVGMQVEIKRSDGRVHGAVVTGVNHATGGVNVEWFEKGETKGKEIDFITLLKINPALNPENGAAKPPSDGFKAPKPPAKRETTANGKRTIPQPKVKTSTASTPIDLDVTFVQSVPANEVTAVKPSQITPEAAELPSLPVAALESPATASPSMDRLNVGMQVEIKRSDGRVHGAVVTAINHATGGVSVEWFEKGETKGKEIDFQSLLKINPALNPVNNAPKPSFNDIQKPPSNGAPKHIINNASKPPADVFKVPKLPTRRETITNGNRPPPKTKIRTSAVTTPIEEDVTFVQNTTITQPPPIEKPLKTIILKNEEPLVSTAKSACVNEVERLAQEREKRRQQQAEVKRQMEAKKSIDPGNPNWQFLGMICDYREQIDFRPLRMDDDVIDNRITVCVRKRPLSKAEVNRREIEVVTIPNKDHLIVHQPQVKVDMTKYLENQVFRFDYTFDENSSNEMVYKFTAQPLVQTIFERGFATCFAYGQTGSGKTHTMGGDFHGKTQDCSKGIYALTAVDVFRMLEQPEYECLGLSVHCSFFEIYGGKVFDLLAKRAVLRILEDGKKSVQVCGLKELPVYSAEDVMKLIKLGSLQRTAGTTSANANSSRSHAVFQIILKHGRKEEVYGKISLIDLAGNERGADTTSSDRETRLEGAEINKSLLALKECIRAMSMNKKHIPFRFSKLTLVLRDSFTNQNAKTCMIAMVSPGMNSVENSLNTLRYADRVKELGSGSVDTKERDDSDE